MKHLSSAAFVVILLLVLFSSCKKGSIFGKSKKKAIAEQQAEQARQDSIRIADSLKQVQETMRALEQARLESVRLAEEEAARLASKYHIIVGSFYTPEYAKSLADKYKQEGYSTQILKRRGSLFEFVSVESFSSLRSAVNRLQEYHEYIMPDAWIYVRD